MRNKMTDVRNLLIQTMEEMLDPETTIDVEKAKVVSQLGNVLVKSAKVEVDYLKAIGSNGEVTTGFMGTDESKQLSDGK